MHTATIVTDMMLDVKPGTYVIAVSGGVDSVVLLDMLAQKPAVELVVAHYDHGMREDSGEDYIFVEQLAKKYGLQFIGRHGQLGKVSEATAREARYAFLRQAQHATKAHTLITAHHQDDVLETMILNMLRGTGRKGLTSLQSTSNILRPLLHIPKAQLVEYAMEHSLTWHEDSTNQSDAYSRNHVRHHILSRFSSDERQRLYAIYTQLVGLNAQIDTELACLAQMISAGEKSINRYQFIMLPHNVARELLAQWLRMLGCAAFDRQLIERLTVQAKTLASGKRANVYGTVFLRIDGEKLQITDQLP